MKNICILGAGLSATSMIDYLLQRAEKYDWNIRLGDFNEALAEEKINGNPRGKSFKFDVKDSQQLETEIQKSDIIVSMMPAMFHHLIAEKCVLFGKNMLTASYISNEMKAINEKAIEAGIGLYNELGVDPGIDHMSAMKVINEIQADGGKLTAFFSSTGGLIAPTYDNNPWNYKFTWNPRNVVVAGQGISKFIRNGMYKYVPYRQLFRRLMTTHIDGYGDFEIYPNRDSLSYRETYNLKDIPTLFRGTMRRPGYANAWNVFVQLGITDDTFVIENSELMTYREFLNAFLPFEEGVKVEEKLKNYLPNLVNDDVINKFNFLELFSNKKIGIAKATPAVILQKILEDKWQLDDQDKDMLVMQHRFEFTDKNGKNRIKTSSLIVEGESKKLTAMAKTVGLPLGIATKLVATGKVKIKGVSAPVMPELYLPILEELKSFGIIFTEKEL
ncbi:MAG: saccharopine dehydrogenase [Bacteroidetes bacterium CG2_30_33_31]|nr:MAG: saccharopine dehydrogenase [Bacteroidetes bacterium CG2_30_33_31]